MGNLGGLAKTGFGKPTRGRIPVPAAFAHAPGAVTSAANGAAKTSFDIGWGTASGPPKRPPEMHSLVAQEMRCPALETVHSPANATDSTPPSTPTTKSPS